MGGVAGLSASPIATFAAGGRPSDLGDEEAIAHDIAGALADAGQPITYQMVDVKTPTRMP